MIIGLKMLEIKTGKLGMFARLNVLVYPILSPKLDVGGKIFGMVNGSNTRKVLAVVAKGLFHVFGTAGLFISKYYIRLTRVIKGKKYINRGGVVSFFLRDVAESKEERKDK